MSLFAAVITSAWLEKAFDCLMIPSTTSNTGPFFDKILVRDKLWFSCLGWVCPYLFLRLNFKCIINIHGRLVALPFTFSAISIALAKLSSFSGNLNRVFRTVSFWMLQMKLVLSSRGSAILTKSQVIAALRIFEANSCTDSPGSLLPDVQNDVSHEWQRFLDCTFVPWKPLSAQSLADLCTMENLIGLPMSLVTVSQWLVCFRTLICQKHSGQRWLGPNLPTETGRMVVYELNHSITRWLGRSRNVSNLLE